LERPSLRREAEFLERARASRALHRGWITTAATAAEYREYLRRCRRRNQESYFVIATAADELAGVVNVNDIVRYAQQSGRLGYYAFVPHAGRGLLAEGLALVLREAFSTLRLHRLEANIQPENARSVALVRRLGFAPEGIARGYLKMGRRWVDHERWALLAEDWRAAQSASRRA
jgi:ribosomal-protein-alanine N-acetyltransferase